MGAPTRSVSIRLGTDGSAEIKNTFKDLQATGNAAFEDIAQSADNSTAAIQRQSNAVQDVVSQLAKAKAQASAASVNTVTGVSSAPATARSSGATYSALSADIQRQSAISAGIIAQVDPAAAATTNYQKTVDTLKKSLAYEQITEVQHAAGLKAAKTALDEVTGAHGKYGNAIKLSSVQTNEFVGILRHTFDALASGANPLTVITQHAASTAQAFGENPNGVGGTFKALGGIVTSAGFAMGATAVLIAGAIGAATVATLKFEEAQSALSFSLAGIGKASGLTTAQLENLAETQAARAKVSVGAARDEEAAYLRMGITQNAVLSNIIGVTKNYALVTGEDAKAATQELGKALADPTEGAKLLAARLGDLDVQTRLHIEDLQNQGDLLGGQKVLFDSLSKSVADESDKISGLKKVLEDTTTAFSNFFAAAGKKIDTDINAVQGKVDPADIIARYKAQHAKGAPGQLQALFSSTLVHSDDSAYQISDQEYQAALQKQKADAATAATAAATARRTILENNAQNNFDRLNPRAKRERDLTSEITGYEKSLKDPNATDFSKGLDAKNLQTAQNDLAKLQKRDGPPKNGRAETLAREAEAVKVNTAETLKLADAYLQGDAAALKAEATRKALTEATKKGTDTDAAVRAEIALEVADQIKSGAKNTLTLNDQTKAQKDINAQVAAGALKTQDAAKALQEENALRPLTTLQALAEGDAKKKLTEVIEALKQAYTDSTAAQNVAAIQASTQADKDQTEVLQDQLDTLKETNAQRAIDLAHRAALRELDDKHIDPNSAEGKAKLSATDEKSTTQNALAGSKFLDDSQKNLNDQIETGKTQLAILGQSASAQAAILDQLKLQQEFRRQGLDDDTKLTADQLAMKQALIATTAEQSAQTALIQQQAAVYAELHGAQDKLFDDLGNYLDSGKISFKSFGDFAKQEIASIAAELIKLALINPLKNAASHENNPTLSDVTSLLAIIPGFATGTDDAPPGYHWVGENGRELESGPGGAKIVPHAKSEALAKSYAAQTSRAVAPPTHDALGATQTHLRQMGYGSGLNPSTPQIAAIQKSGGVTIIQNHNYDLTKAMTTKEFMDSVDKKVAAASVASAKQAVRTANAATPDTLAKWQANKG